MGFPNLNANEILEARLAVYSHVEHGIAVCDARWITPERAAELLTFLSLDHIRAGCVLCGGWVPAVILDLTLADASDAKIAIDSGLTNWVCRRNGIGDRTVRPGFAAALARVVAEG